ncbi:hypothetical protein [Amaricoccus macauensis]|uniref:hypothetical protein n=1 Tax=Amaricoccus macauensis TaxID=57001 RepID=UPI003C7D5592
MFGFKRKAVTQRVIEAVRPNIAAAQMVGGIDRAFWDDRAVLGYLFGQILIFIKIQGGNRLSNTETAQILADTFTALSNANGERIATEVARLNQTNEPDFEAAKERGMVVVSYTLGLLKNEQHEPLVLEAMYSIEDSGSEPSRENVSGYLFHMFWTERTERLRETQL